MKPVCPKPFKGNSEDFYINDEQIQLQWTVSVSSAYISTNKLVYWGHMNEPMDMVGITECSRLLILHILFYSILLLSCPVVIRRFRQSFQAYVEKLLQIRPRPVPHHFKLGYGHFLLHHFIFLTHCLRYNSLLQGCW